MKIFVLGIRGFPNIQGGAEKHCEELYPRLVELGCEVIVPTRTPYIPKEKRIFEWVEGSKICLSLGASPEESRNCHAYFHKFYYLYVKKARYCSLS